MARSLSSALGKGFAGLDDGRLVRVVFFASLLGTMIVLGLDFRALWLRQPPVLPDLSNPILPPDRGPAAPAAPPPAPVRTAPEDLSRPLEISLLADGILRLRGAVTPGSGERLAEEIAERGAYVKRITLDSPGGLVSEALDMGRLIREAGFATHVAEGSYCASSCPLVLAGGATRTAESGAVIGVHQIYTPPDAALPLRELVRTPQRIERDTQAATASITRYLREMDVDPALWILALETPPERLRYLSAAELAEYRLANAPRDTE